jgi:hypothetical protein
MELARLFLLRYDVLYDSFMAGFWNTVPEELLRQRPDPRVNSIAWNLWHIARAEDAGLNRFVVDSPQVLDEGGWMEKMNLPWRHHGCEMTLAEVDELDRSIDLPALRLYSQAIHARTHEIIARIDQVDLEAKLQEDQVRKVIVDEGLAHSNPEGFIQNYSSWTKGKSLMTLGLTHSFQHVGEMDVIATLLGVVFE